jgi:uncharacterized membrane protein (DUF2068 family)
MPGGPGRDLGGRWWPWWRSPETLACGVRGHVVPARQARRLPAPFADLVTTTTDGRRLGRCIRCGAWIEAPEDQAPADVLSPLREEDVPRRGSALREAMVLRLIAVERAVHSLFFGLAALGLLMLRLNLGGLQQQARYLTDTGMGGFAGPGQTASRSSIVRWLDRLLDLRRGTLGVLALAAAVYCVLEGAEAVGLWHERRWAEYLTAVATAGFLPFELNELWHRVTVLRLGALVVNVAVLVYLVWRKHLFDVGGRRPETRRLSELTDAW